MAPPVSVASTRGNRPSFTWQTAALVFYFDFFEDRLRLQELLPEGMDATQTMPPPSEISGLETSTHCTGEDVPDHHGQKLSGGCPAYA